ncbi:MAG: energy transducer TonB [Pyrinomonadaceae bacterium]|nr:energy transducer TonB [Sphingobacteriaceae bacterium]
MTKVAKLLVGILLILYYREAHGQPLIEDNNIYSAAAIKTKPAYPGGIEKFTEYLESNFKFSPEALKANLSGKLILSFVIEKDGSLSTFNVIKDIGFDTGKEALRLLEGSRKWIPASQNGERVRVRFIMPIMLNAGGDFHI